MYLMSVFDCSVSKWTSDDLIDNIHWKLIGVSIIVSGVFITICDIRLIVCHFFSHSLFSPYD